MSLVACGPIVVADAALTVAAPTSIPSDCSRDVTAALNTWIASVPDNATLSFAPNGCYRVDGTLLVVDRVGLVFEGNHATFRAVTDGSELGNTTKIRMRSMWQFGGGSHITVRNLVVIGANPAAGRGDAAYQPRFEAQHGFLIQGPSSMLVERVTMSDVYGDFVFVGAGTDGLTVRDSVFTRNGRQGWTINGSNITFERNSISETRRATINMEPTYPTWASKNVMIRDNDIGKGRLFFFSSVGAPFAPMENINIVGNRLHGKVMQIYVVGAVGARGNYHVLNNTSDGITSGFGATMVFRNVNDIEVRNNVQRLQPSHWLAGVSIMGATHTVVSGNNFRGGKAAVLDRGGNVDISQSNNIVGAPPFTAASSTVPGPTLAPATRAEGAIGAKA